MSEEAKTPPVWDIEKKITAMDEMWDQASSSSGAPGTQKGGEIIAITLMIPDWYAAL